MSKSNDKRIEIQKDLETEVADLVETVDLPEAEEPVEVADTPKAVAPVAQSADTYTAVEGDTYASIAKKFRREGLSSHTYSTLLFVENGGRNITAGTVIKL